MKDSLTPEDAVDALIVRHETAVAALKAALLRFAEGGAPPSTAERAQFHYPLLRVRYAAAEPRTAPMRAYAQLTWPGVYEVSITQPAHFRRYLLEQLDLLVRDFGVTIEIATSGARIPYSFVMEGGPAFAHVPAAALARHFPTPQLIDVGDGAVDGDAPIAPGEARRLALFDAPRIDYSLKRIEHYTGAPWQDVQPWILFTNYQRYVDEFARWAEEQIAAEPGAYLSCPGRTRIDGPGAAAAALATPWRNHQMPAWHLVRPGGQGVSLVNIGVGPSNAKTITDHLAVLRPHCWLMIGHCGGLRHTQRVGDYVLAHAYLRRDGILDQHVPLEIPVPAIAEVQVALEEAAARASGEEPEELKRRLRTGTVVSYADRNWELNFRRERQMLSQSRAIAVDMESACIATQGFRMRVPYGVLLCVSDKPLHGEIKLPGGADHFYERAVASHLRIGLETISILQRDQAELHSRKLRSFEEPPFR